MRDMDQFWVAPADDPSAESEWATSEATTAPLDVVTGRVKWFDVVRGFGFVVAEGVEGDILLHYNLLTPHGRKSLPEGTLVTAVISEGKRGRIASEILSFDLATAIPGDTERPPARVSARPDPIALLDSAGDFTAVQVRWFNRTKGYGFLLAADGVTEIFIHMAAVRRAGFDALNPGQRLRARIAEGPRGAFAVLIEEDMAAHG